LRGHTEVQPRSDRSNFERGVDILCRRGLWIPLCCILAAGAAYGYSKHQVKKYTATASLVFKSNVLAQQVAGLPTTLSAQASQGTDLRLVQVGDMAAKTASRLGQGLTAQKVSASISVAQQGETNVVGETSVINVSASVTSPTLAAQIANTYAQQFVAEQQASYQQFFTAALATVSKQLAKLPPKQRLGGAGVDLQNRAQELKTLSELQYGGVQVAQSAVVPSSSSSPRTSRDTAIGAALGLLVGFCLVLMLERFDPRIREPEELEAIYGAPLLGVVSRGASRSRSKQPAPNTAPGLPPNDAEAFRLVLAHLRSFNAERELHAVLVTSATPSSGTTIVARNLAEAAARSGSRTLLLEMNLRRPVLADDLSIRPAPGLKDVLTDAASISNAAQTIQLPAPAGGGITGPTLSILTSGTSQPSDPGELITSSSMGALLDRIRATYDLVVLDAPSLIEFSDAFPVLPSVDGVIVVNRIGRDRRDVAEQLRQILDRSAAPLLGVVANRFKSKRRDRRTHDHPEDNGAPSAVSAPDSNTSSDEPRLTVGT
jgi:capsular exopolysaccharide synthesis family protein